MANMLLEAGVIQRGAPYDELLAIVAVILDDGETRGVRTERLLGMYLLLRTSNMIEPFDDPEYSLILRDESLPEADKAHSLQMTRLARLG